MKQVLYLTVISGLLFSCAGGTAESDKNTKEFDWEGHLKDNRTALQSWTDEINALEGQFADPLVFEEKSDIDFKFSPVRGTHSGNASVNDDFNAIYISTYAFEKEYPDEMSKDMFHCSIFSVVRSLLNDEEMSIHDKIPRRTDDRFNSAALAYMKATTQVKYVFLVDVQIFGKGSVLAMGQNALLTPGKMTGTMTIYDLEEKQLLEFSAFEIPGFENLSYSYDKDGGSDAPQNAAEHSLNEENKKYYPKEILDRYAPNNNWIP